MSEFIKVSLEAPLCLIRIARPEKKNALTSPMYAAMTAALAAANADAAIRVICILGAPGMFSAGNDIQEFMTFAKGGALGPEVVEFLKSLATNEKPLVAGVDGIAVGIGATLLLHCDYVVASERTNLSTPFASLGLVPEAGSSLLGPRLMGHARAFAMLAMGRPMPARQAEVVGLVNEVVAPEEVERQALAAARDIAARPAEAMAIARALLRPAPAETLARIEREVVLFGERLRSDEARAAFNAFLSRK